MFAVRIPLALRDALDRYLDALETRIGLKASRHAVIRQAWRQCLAAEQHAGQPRRPSRVEAP